jgi:hypothetical protein
MKTQGAMMATDQASKRRARLVLAGARPSCCQPMGESVCFGREERMIAAAVCTCRGSMTARCTAASATRASHSVPMDMALTPPAADITQDISTSLQGQTHEKLSHSAEKSQPQAKRRSVVTFVERERVGVAEPPANELIYI